jgi:hypothetical protein
VTSVARQLQVRSKTKTFATEHVSSNVWSFRMKYKRKSVTDHVTAMSLLHTGQYRAPDVPVSAHTSTRVRVPRSVVAEAESRPRPPPQFTQMYRAKRQEQTNSKRADPWYEGKEVDISDAFCYKTFNILSDNRSTTNSTSLSVSLLFWLQIKWYSAVTFPGR